MTETIEKAIQDLASGRVTSCELVETALTNADQLDGTLGVFMDRYEESARKAAQSIDEARSRGEEVGPLGGIPLGIKDIITTLEGPTTAQSLVFDPSSFRGDATVVARLREAGAIIVGKTTTMEFAIGTPDVDKPFPIPRNPWDIGTWPGGSSSGTGAGVASEMFLGGLGTDTGGSIRLPAANCGITGLKPTFGRVPKDGCAPLGFSLDHIGPMARSAYDCALMLNTMAGYGPHDVSAADVETVDYTAQLDADLTGMRIGIDRLEKYYSDLSAVTELVDGFTGLESALRARGAEVVQVTQPFRDEVSAAAMILMITEGFAYHRNDLRDRWDDYSRGLRDCLAMAPFYSAADVIQAQRVRRVGVKAVAQLFDDVDVVISPTTTAGAMTFAQVETMWDGPASLHMTGYWNGCGNPSMAVPFGFTESGLPISVEIAGKPYDEATVLKVGHAFQQETDFHLRQAPMAQEPLSV